MPSRYRLIPAPFALASLLAAIPGCAESPKGPTVTGTREEAAGTHGPSDPGKLNAGGPGVPAELRKEAAQAK